MRKFAIILSAFLASTIFAEAQTLKGNMMAGGGLSFSSSTLQGSGDYDDKDFGLSPGFGYFLIDNLAVGASISISSSTFDNGATKTVSTSFGFGPFARYYKFTSNENFAFFGQAQLLLSSGKVDNTPGGETKSGSVQFSIAPGFAYFFNEHWGLELGITGLVIRSYDPDKDADNDKQNSIQLGLSSFSPSIGLRYHFGG